MDASFPCALPRRAELRRLKRSGSRRSPALRKHRRRGNGSQHNGFSLTIGSVNGGRSPETSLPPESMSARDSPPVYGRWSTRSHVRFSAPCAQQYSVMRTFRQTEAAACALFAFTSATPFTPIAPTGQTSTHTPQATQFSASTIAIKLEAEAYLRRRAIRSFTALSDSSMALA